MKRRSTFHRTNIPGWSRPLTPSGTWTALPSSSLPAVTWSVIRSSSASSALTRSIAASAMTELVLRNRQRTRPLNSPLLRRITRVLLTDLLSLERFDLAIHLVAAPEMARLNQRFLDHAGSTDVITFDYAGEPDSMA